MNRNKATRKEGVDPRVTTIERAAFLGMAEENILSWSDRDTVSWVAPSHLETWQARYEDYPEHGTSVDKATRVKALIWT